MTKLECLSPENIKQFLVFIHELKITEHTSKIFFLREGSCVVGLFAAIMGAIAIPSADD